MKRSTFLAAVLAIVILPFLAPTQSSAEWFGDLYGGAAFTQNHDVEIDFRSVGVTETARDVRFDTAGLIGGRAGYWFQSFSFLGVEPAVGLDVSHLFGSDIGHQTPSTKTCAGSVCVTGPVPLDKVKVDVTIIGFDVMLRYPLFKSQRGTWGGALHWPKGQLYPYLTAGPAVFIAHAKDTTNFLPANQSDTDTRVGVKVGAGLAWQFRKIAVFGEYRFTHFDPTFHFNVIGVGTDVSTSGNTHAILVGVSFHFP